MAFCELPALGDFLAVRLNTGFKLREDFEARADTAHDAFMLGRGLGCALEVLAHLNHFTESLRIQEKREPSEEELDDIRHMLSQRGVRRIPDSVMKEAMRRHGTSAGMPLTQIVQSLRGQHGSVLRKHATAKRQVTVSGSSAKSSSLWQCTDNSEPLVLVCQAILKEHAYPEDHIRDAIICCGANVKRAVEFCLLKQQGLECSETAVNTDQQEISRQYMTDMGFPEKDIIATLEQVDFDFTEALRLLLSGIQGDAVDGHWKNNIRTQQLTARMKRRTVKIVKNIPSEVLKLPRGVAELQYADRAAYDLGRADLAAYDLGWEGEQGTTNACFWLCLAAAWSHVDVTTPVLWREATLFEEMTRVDRQTVADLLQQQAHHVIPLPRGNAIGVLALKLRQHFCGFTDSPTGETCVMRRPDVVQRFFPAYAALAGSSTSQMLPMQMYKQWIQRVRLHEFADELIVAAAARELGVCIVCVPYTPADSLGLWKISSYSALNAGARTVYLANNDVHYMVLLPM